MNPFFVKLLKIVLVIIVVAAALHLLNGGTLSLEDINNHAKDLLQANNENVIAVKYGSPQAYPNITYCMAFESFFIITLFSGEAAQSFSCVVS